jgi:glucose/arabinose dehydrogenase/mono/diheme cytochrome c family protein
MRRLIALTAVCPTLVLAQSGDRREHTNTSPVVPTELIPAAPVLDVAAALKSFQVSQGFLIEPFAAEPLVDKPVALDYDSAGRLWVCEMVGYMTDIDGNNESVPQGRIVVLEDSDGDGKADVRTVFLDKLLLPRAVAVFADGVLFTDDSELLFVKREGLKPVGEPEVAVKGFVEAGNVEHKSNGLMHGLDNWLYNAKSGKRVRRVNGTWVMEETAYRGQWGIAKDNYGRLYHNNNSTFLFGDYLAPNLLQGNPGVNLKTSDANQLGPNNTWPIRVTPGVNRAYMAKANGYGSDTLDPQTHKLISATAAAGMTIYRGTNFPAEWHGRGLVTESSVNLVKAVEIKEDDGRLTGSHPLGKSEWLASTDERFRPVNIYNAPDGSIHLLDMYHGIIQHKTFLTSYLREQYLSRGLEGPGAGHGRIYRVRHNGGKLEKIVDLETLSTEDLVKLLAHRNGWHRDMAQRVLIDRADPESVPLLEKLVGMHAHPLAQIHAIWTLEGLGRLTATSVATAVLSPDTKVVCSALWAVTRLPAEELVKLEPVLLKCHPANNETKIYLARALGPLGTSGAFEALVKLMESDGKNRLVRAAVFSGLDHRELAFKAAAGERLKDKDFIAWLDQGAAATAGPKPPGAGLDGETRASFLRGRNHYLGAAACFGCHGAAGEGVTNLGPPLDGSQWVTGDPEVLAKVLLHGLTGPIVVAGETYESTADMPGLAQNPSISDADLADIATYVRNEWSNRAPLVNPEIFKKVRKETQDRSGRPYTAQDLGM